MVSGMVKHPFHGWSGLDRLSSAALLAYAARLGAPKQPPAHRQDALQVLDLLQCLVPFGFREEVALP
jgi:hypothetical protein